MKSNRIHGLLSLEIKLTFVKMSIDRHMFEMAGSIDFQFVSMSS